MNKAIKIKHPDVDAEGSCMPEALHVWEDHGWSEVKESKGKSAHPALTEKASSKKDDSKPQES